MKISEKQKYAIEKKEILNDKSINFNELPTTIDFLKQYNQTNLFNKKTCEKILDLFASGHSENMVLAELKIARETFSHWLKNIPDFRIAIESTKRQLIADREKNLIFISEDFSNERNIATTLKANELILKAHDSNYKQSNEFNIDFKQAQMLDASSMQIALLEVIKNNPELLAKVVERASIIESGENE